MSAVLQARGIGYRRAGRDVLAGLDFDAQEREIVALVGPSGSGKSSMLTLLAGLEEPDEGIVTRTIGLADTAVVLQAYGLVPLLTAEENVAIPLLAPGRSPVSPAEARRRTGDALALLQVEDLHAHLVETLSGGQQQRVALARALVVRPQLLLADEPTAALDGSNRLRVIQVLRDLRNLGSTIVLATHDPVVAAMADRVVSIKDGRNAS